MSLRRKPIEWLVIGSRRWARVITDELCKIIPSKIDVFHDIKDVDSSIWKESLSRYSNLNFVDRIVPIDFSTTGIAIVANSAYLHHSTIKEALNAGYHVISEKPLSFSKKETLSLLRSAKEKNLTLLPINTYCFATYLKKIKDTWLKKKNISKIEIHWSDPRIESRYGEKKRYDSSVPIIYDILPHVAAILKETFGEINISSSDIKVFNGGSTINIDYECTNLNVNLILNRNAQKRLRRIKYYGHNLELSFDFTAEPGEVTFNGNRPVINPEPHWNSQRKPLAEMLYSLKDYFEKEAQESRFSNDVAILSNILIDAVAHKYVEHQVNYLNSSISSIKHTEDKNFSYAMKEAQSLAQRTGPYLSKDSPLEALVQLYNSSLI